MGFGSYVGGIMLCILAVLLVFVGFAVLLGLVSFIAASYDILLGIAILVAAGFIFLYGWYLYKSAKPKGTLNVHNT